MSIANIRRQEGNRIKNTVQHQLRLQQTHGTANSQVNGYRSLGFYQAGRYSGSSGQSMIVGSRTGDGTLVN